MKMKILVTAAHPDDETLGCGGTIAKLSRKGHEVHLLTFTDGIGARLEGDRRSELYDVSKILGISQFESFDFPDNQMDTVPLLSVVKKIEDYLEKNNLNPDWVMTHTPDCLNIDHKIVHTATLTAFRGLSYYNPIKIMCYEVPSSSEWNPLKKFMPNFYVSLSKEDFQKKMSALNVYDGEIREFPHPRSYKNIDVLACATGSEVGYEKSEKFMIIRETT
jgi:LmbE family N-acetylglucosaminyl deacetylase